MFLKVLVEVKVIVWVLLILMMFGLFELLSVVVSLLIRLF